MTDLHWLLLGVNIGLWLSLLLPVVMRPRRDPGTTDLDQPEWVPGRYPHGVSDEAIQQLIRQAPVNSSTRQALLDEWERRKRLRDGEAADA